MTRHPGDALVESRVIAEQEVTLSPTCVRNDCPLCEPLNATLAEVDRTIWNPRQRANMKERITAAWKRREEARHA